MASLAALSSALLLWAASPAVGQGGLAWLAIVPAATVALSWPGTRSGRLAVPLAYVLYLELLLAPALPFGLAAGQWGDLPPPLMIADSPAPLVCLVAVPLAGAVLYAVRFGLPARSPGGEDLTGLRAIGVPALAWTALDLVRAKFGPGGFFGPLFASQYDTAGAELAALGGPWLLTFAIVGCNYALALGLVRGRAALRPLAAATVVAGLLAAGASAVGADGGSTGPEVAAIQPGYDTAEEDRPELRFFEGGTYHLAASDTIDDLGELTTRAAAEGAELLAWPEAAIFVDPRHHSTVLGELEELGRRSGAPIVVPYFAEETSQSAAVVVSPETGLGRAAPKRRPMWFLGERAGEGEPGPIEVDGLQIGTMLGVDAQDPGIARSLVAEGADVLVSSTHDWPALAVQQRAFARLAAVATGVPVIRADWRYGSAVYGPGGAPLADAGLDQSRTAVATVATIGSVTPYARIGDALGWTALAAVAAMAAGLAVSRARHRLRRVPLTAGAAGPTSPG